MPVVAEKSFLIRQIDDIFARIEKVSGKKTARWVTLIALAMSLYHLTVAYLGQPVTFFHLPIHVLFAFLVIFWSLPVNKEIGLTATLDVLKAIADGSGPRKSLLALGYSGWGPGQLEGEIQGNGWLHCDADDILIFDSKPDERYDQALAKIGVDPALLSSSAGHA